MIARRLRFAIFLAAAGMAAAAAWAAAPTLAADRSAPRVPAASDFTQALPAAAQLRERSPRSARIAERRKGYGIEGPLLYRTPAVEAPRRFDLVGVAGEMHALEYRARRGDGPWSDWVEADNGDPVYTGGTDEVQIRSRGVPVEGELHYVDVDGGSAPAGARGRSSRGGRGDRGLAPKPRFVSRSEWGATGKKTGCLPREAAVQGRVRAAVVHHTVSTNDYSEAEAPGLVLGICRYHRDGNGWNDIGYNALVDRFGNIYEGRAGGVDKPIVGAQAEGHNLQTAGVAVIGNRSQVAPSGPERKTLIKYLAWRLGVARIESALDKTSLTSSGGSSTRTPRGKSIRVNRILSHSDTNFTECAGLDLRAQLPKIRRAVQRRMDEFGSGEPVDPTDPEVPVHPPVDPVGGARPRR